jgi:probable rRNA maturation factor
MNLARPMTSKGVSKCVSVDLQNVIGDRGVPAPGEWSGWVNAAFDVAEPDGRPGDMTVRLVGRDEGETLNSTYRNKSGPTNVLAFPGPDAAVGPLDSGRILGDLVICLPVVYDEAAEQGKPPVAHMAHMVVHGTLHLLGYDHDTDASAGRMEELETGIMCRLGYPDPYELV